MNYDKTVEAASSLAARWSGNSADAWVAVSDRLPERETDVLCFIVRGISGRLEVAGLFPSDGTASNPKGWGWYSYAKPEDELSVTHWMPLPKWP